MTGEYYMGQQEFRAKSGGCLTTKEMAVEER
jgi:hypothetical protein